MKTICDLNTLGDDDNSIIANSILNLDPEFYNKISDDNHINLVSVKKLLKSQNTDCGCGKAIIEDGKLLGYFSAFPLSEVKIRTLASMKFIIETLKKTQPDSVPKFLSNSSDFSKRKEPFPEPLKDYFYLNKIESFQSKKGVGLELFLLYLDSAKSKSLTPIFHVKRDNLRAIQFYKSLNFKVINEKSKFDYILVGK